jgi:ribonuclease Z
MQSDAFLVRPWGVRGEGYSRVPGASAYGGNTCCVEMRCGDDVLIFDAGSGLRMLGEHLCGGPDTTLNLYFSHFHYDHISGLPFFAPLFCDRFRVDFWSGHLPGKNATRNAIHDYMRHPFFPVGPEVFSAEVAFHDFEQADDIRLSSRVNIRTCALNHQGGGTAYRVEYGGKAACYVTDTAHVAGKPDSAILSLIRGADLVIYDATYTDEEWPEFSHFGHSTWEEGVRLCKAAGAARLGIFHHRQIRTDVDLDRIGEEATEQMSGSFVVREGETIHL